MGDIVKGMVEPLAKRWSATLGGALLLFWLSGALIVLHQYGTPSDACRSPGEIIGVVCDVAARGVAGQTAIAVSALACVILSGIAAAAATGPVLQCLAGRWGTWGPTVALARRRTRYHAERRNRLRRRWNPTPAAADHVEAAQRAWSAARAHERWRRIPLRAADRQPTAIGNTFQALCVKIRLAYGLDLPVCWQPLTESLDPETRTRLATAATSVLSRVQTLICCAFGALWGLALPGWTPKIGWFLGSILLCVGAHHGVRKSVEHYCRHVDATVAVHRVRLYRAIGIAPPATTSAERAAGETLSAWLRRDLASDTALDWPVG